MSRALLVALLWSFGAFASAETPRIENPVWLQEPDGRAFAENYPSQAAFQAVEGYATIECYVRLDTQLDCMVVAEGPASWGFGDAALAIARTFRVRPAQRDGVAVEGGRIRRTLRFVLPEVDWHEEMPPEFRAYAEDLAPPDLPTWDEAPTSSIVIAATPEAMRTAGTQGRGVLSCRVNALRRLNCTPAFETPRDSGFAAAALTLAPHFRIAQSDQDFIARYTNEPFLLPIAFNAGPQLTPVNRGNVGLGPVDVPPLPTPAWMMPERARAAGITNATVVLICTTDLDRTATCAVESETPRDWDIGQGLVEAISGLPPWPPESGLMPGDQVRYTFEFEH